MEEKKAKDKQEKSDAATAKKVCKSDTNVSGIKRKIKAVLVERGDYSPDLDFLIELCAGSYSVYRTVLNEIQSLPSPFIVETSREGHDREVLHPALKMLLNSGDNLRKLLSELNLTPKILAKPSTRNSIQGKRQADNDRFVELLNKINAIGSDD